MAEVDVLWPKKKKQGQGLEECQCRYSCLQILIKIKTLINLNMFFPSSSPFPSSTPPAPPSSLLCLIMQHIALLHSQYLCTILHCTTLQCTALHCSKLQFLRYTALHSFVELYTSVGHCNLLDLTCIAICTVLYCTVLYKIIASNHTVWSSTI